MHGHVDAAQRVHGQIAENPFVAVLAHEHHAVAALDSQHVQPRGHAQNVVGDFLPGEPVILSPALDGQRRTRAILLDAIQEKREQCRV